VQNGIAHRENQFPERGARYEREGTPSVG